MSSTCSGGCAVKFNYDTVPFTIERLFRLNGLNSVEVADGAPFGEDGPGSYRSVADEDDKERNDGDNQQETVDFFHRYDQGLQLHHAVELVEGRVQQVEAAAGHGRTYKGCIFSHDMAKEFADDGRA